MICEGDIFILIKWIRLNQLFPEFTPATFQWENDLDSSSQIWAKAMPFDLFRCHTGGINLISP